MTDAEFRTAIGALGLSQVGAGRFLTGSPRSGQRYASGETPVPKPVAMLLRIMIASDLTATDVEFYHDHPTIRRP